MLYAKFPIADHGQGLFFMSLGIGVFEPFGKINLNLNAYVIEF